jgi:UDP-N-acetylglucosamine 2-epimerase
MTEQLKALIVAGTRPNFTKVMPLLDAKASERIVNGILDHRN